MARYNKPPKTKAKQPDEFVSFFDRLVRYFAQNKASLFGLVALVILAMGAYGAFLYYQNQSLKKYAELYGQALKAKPEQAIQNWEKLIQNAPPKALKQIFAMHLGAEYAKNKKWSKAAKAFTIAQKNSSKLLSYLGQWSTALAYENAKEWKQAKLNYEKISKQDQHPFRDEARLGVARTLIAMGKPDEASTLLKDLIAENSQISQAIQSAALNQLLVLSLK